MNKGRLILIPAFLDESNDINSLIPAYKETIYGINIFIVEEVRTARRFLRKIGYSLPFEQVRFLELNSRTNPSDIDNYLEDAMIGADIGLISEAGTPCVADPGSEIVRMAHRKNIAVKPLSGFSSIILALMASGFNGQNFIFHGYLPVDQKARESKLREIEQTSFRLSQTQIFMETPYRNNQMIASILKVCQPETGVCIAGNLTSPEIEYIHSKAVWEWKKDIPDLHKRPAIFLVYAGK